MRYRIGDLLLDVGVHEVSRDGEAVPLPPLSFDLLLALARHAPDLVSNEQLGLDVWPGLVVSPGTVVKRVGLLREALGDDVGNPRYIRVVRGCGYRLIPPVEHDRATRAVEKPPVGESRRFLRRPFVGILALLTGLVAAVLPLVPDSNRDHVAEPGEAASESQNLDMPASDEAGQRTPKLSIAVLPFVTLTDGREDRVIANGLAEGVINLLAAMKPLQVVARSSSFKFGEGGLSIDEIAGRLNVAHILEGSLQRHGGQIRVTAQLIDVRTGYDLWSGSYDRDFGDILALQDDIALNIASALEIALVDRETPDSTGSHTDNADAYALYLKGRNLLHQRVILGGAGLGAAVSAFENAISLDPEFARAWAGLATALWLRPIYSYQENTDEEHRRAEEAARHALELDPDIAEALGLLGNLAWRRGDFETAGSYYEQAMRETVPASEVWLSTGIFQNSVGYTDNAFEIFEQANRLDPFNHNLVGFLAGSHMMMGEADKAARLLETLPKSPMTEYSHAIARLLLGEREGAREVLSGLKLPFGVFPPQYVDLVIGALAEPERLVEVEKRILNAMHSGALDQRVGFELLWVLSSPAILEVVPEIATGYRALRVAEVAWGVRGAAFRMDERFHRWAHDVGLVDYWNRHGWPGQCKAGQGETLVCD